MPEKQPEKAPGAFSLLGTASTMGLHMVSGPVVGGGLGWLIDWWLDSWPVGASVGLLLGVVAGFRNVLADARYLERSNAAIDAERKKQEENAGKSTAKGPSAPEKAAFVHTAHKAGKADGDIVLEVDQTSAATPVQCRADRSSAPAATGEMDGEECFTASLFAGTASAGEGELEELDETVEAIKRVLKGEAGSGEGQKKAAADGTEGRK